MAICDVCSMSVDFDKSYALTTLQVAGEKNYWSYMIERHSFDDDLLLMYVQQQAAQRTGWLVCENCRNMFTFDEQTAKKYANLKQNPPGSGPADINVIAAAAAKAWKEIKGIYPSWAR